MVVAVVAAGGYAAEEGVAGEYGGIAEAHGGSSCRRAATKAVARNTGCSEEAIGRSRRGGRRHRQEPEADV